MLSDSIREAFDIDDSVVSALPDADYLGSGRQWDVVLNLGVAIGAASSP